MRPKIEDILLAEAEREFGKGSVTVERQFTNESVGIVLNGTTLSAFGPYGAGSMEARPEQKRRFARDLVGKLRTLVDDKGTVGFLT